MIEIITVISSVLIPAIVGAITAIFATLTKYKKDLLQAKLETETMFKDLELMKSKLSVITTEKEKLEQENKELYARIEMLENKIAELEKNRE